MLTAWTPSCASSSSSSASSSCAAACASASSSAAAFDVDVAVVGAGIVGLACARELLRRHPHLRLAVLEKEADVARHQSSHSSNVIHAGIYYAPGSMRARLCVRGLDLMYAYCAAKRLPHEACGKLIVAVEPDELPRLHALYERGRANGVAGLRLLATPDEIRAVEPHCRGLAALHSPRTGITDFAAVARAMADDVRGAGGAIHVGYPVVAMAPAARGPTRGVRLASTGGRALTARYVLGCAGLYSDKVGRMLGAPAAPKIVGFRGEYLELKPAHRHLVRGLIYPVNNPKFPFLGVHFTKRTDGGVDLGPNAVLTFAREGYSYRDVNLRELGEALLYRGMQRLLARHWRDGLVELQRSLFAGAQVRNLQRYVPELRPEHVQPGHAGVRAMLLDPAGKLVEDFEFDHLGGVALNVRNAPSPAATSSLAIAEAVADRMGRLFDLAPGAGAASAA